MKEKKFNSNIESIYRSLSDAQKTEYKGKQEKLSKIFFIIGIIFAPIIIALLVLCLVMCLPGKEYALLSFSIALVGIIGVIEIWMISTSLMCIKGSDEVKIKMYIQRLEKKKEIAKNNRQNAMFKDVYYRLDFDNIISVSILDSYTELSDKLHAVLNYQEIIQTRIYKFKVDYKDGTSNIITAAENSEEYSALMPLVNKKPNVTTTIPVKSNVEKIREYKQLLDEGIITQEEFEEKKKELL